MAQTFVDIRLFHQPLQDAGLVPVNCRVLDISIGVTGALTVRYEVYLSADDLVKLGTVFHDVGVTIVREREEHVKKKAR